MDKPPTPAQLERAIDAVAEGLRHAPWSSLADWADWYVVRDEAREAAPLREDLDEHIKIVALLNAQLDDLRAEIARLKEENSNLQADLSDQEL